MTGSKNFLIISPNYPNGYYKFCIALKMHGFYVFGLGDSSVHDLNPELASALTEYVQVDNLGNYSYILDAARYFAEKYGSLAGIESNNECWLGKDALLRRDLGVEGLQPEKLETYQYKSKMKAIFEAAGVATAPFLVTKNVQDVQVFINQHGYPIFAKPNKGVGARAIQKISGDAELSKFFESSLQEDFIFEVYIEGNLYSYDGLTDKQGNIVFEAAHMFTMPIDKLKASGGECVYYTLRTIPDKLKKAGRNTVAGAGLTQRFFHIEFFELIKPIKDVGKVGDFVGIEVNMRPAGGYTPEMINIAKDINIYELWAECMARDAVPQVETSNDLFCVNIGRHNKKQYLYDVQQIQEKYADKFVFAAATDTNDNPFGNYEIIGKFESLEEAEEFCEFATKMI